MTNRPNILFISIDDLNDWVGELGGYPGVLTPNIDRLAGRGTLFSNAHTPVPVCNGARTAVLTGLQPSSTGIYSNDQDWRTILPNVVTIPEYFRSKGYQTIGAGKIFHNVFEKPEVFDQYFLPNPSPKSSKSQNPKNPIGFGSLNVSIEDMSDAQVAGFVAEYFKNDQEQPFFLAVGLDKPHTPLNVPKEFFDLYPLETVQLPDVLQNDLKDVPRQGKNIAKGANEYQRIVKSGEWREIVQAYLASVSFTDAMVGRVLDALYSSPYSDNTIVVLWSDNGWHLGEKLHWKKETLWEEATRVPLIISAPSIADKGEVSPQAVSLLDLYPTLLELAGLPAKNNLEGESLVPLLDNHKAVRKTPAVSFWEYSFSVRTERWRYIQYFDGSEELYDHNKDPNEFKNLANKTKYKQIKENLAQWIPDRKNQQVGTRKNDRLEGDEQNNVLIGDDGNDVLKGGGGDDYLIGMKGDDILAGGYGSDFLIDKKGDDLLLGGKGNDQLTSGNGNDRLQGGGGNDRLSADPGEDILIGNGGNDTLDGNVGDDILKGGRGDDTLKGDEGDDLLIGGKGNDLCRGQKGNDTIVGGQGSDIFVFDSSQNSVDLIKDFVPSEDTILISIRGFELPVVMLNTNVSPEQFLVGDIAKDGDDFIIYNPQSGILLFDSDGNGSIEPVQIAIFANQPLLSADDIFIGDILSS
jgi:arylsulfatase A-like enzyme